jgi:hypothetical protein
LLARPISHFWFFFSSSAPSSLYSGFTFLSSFLLLSSSFFSFRVFQLLLFSHCRPTHGSSSSISFSILFLFH